MRTNIIIDNELLARVMHAFDAKTETQAVDSALREILMLRQQEALMELWGLGWEGDLDDMRTSKYISADE